MSSPQTINHRLEGIAFLCILGLIAFCIFTGIQQRVIDHHQKTDRWLEIYKSQARFEYCSKRCDAAIDSARKYETGSPLRVFWYTEANCWLDSMRAKHLESKAIKKELDDE
jgi:hypothetical protein